jgi:hypothetical protein
MTVATRPPAPSTATGAAPAPGAAPGSAPAPGAAAGAPAATLLIRPWPDQVIDALGFDPRSSYVETYWLGVLGPSTTWLLRRLAAGLEAHPSGFELDLPETAFRLGLGARGGRHSPFARALGRCVQFGLARQEGRDGLGVRRKLPPLTRRQLVRLPTSLQQEHDRWQDAERVRPEVDRLRLRSRRLALSLLELGEDLETTERQLLRWRFHPALAREAAAWAWDRHRAALKEAEREAAG